MSATYTVERSRTLDAPAERVRGLTEDFHAWPRYPNLTWRMTGPRPLLLRLAGPLMDIVKLVGRDFDRGLDKLAVVASQA